MPAMITTMDEARKHRRYALAILMVVYVMNFIDRQIVNILAEPIKQDLGISDAQLGLLTGLSFAIVYCTCGIPVARIADATSRKLVISASLGIWSGFTALCGLATNYTTLLLARLGVGVGEAGGSPPAHAIVSDLYEREKRGRALAIYSSGLYVGTLIGYVLGGWLSDAFTWRQAFFAVGVPGVLLALFLQFTLREPVKGLSGTEKPAPTTFLKAFGFLWRLKSFRYYAIATGAGTFVTYGIGNWMPSFLARSHGEWGFPEVQQMLGFCNAATLDTCAAMSRTEIGLFYGVVAGLCGAVGTIGGGYVADRLGATDRRWFLWVPMWGKLIGGPLFVLGLFAPSPELALALYAPGLVLAAAYLGPSLAITHALVPPSMRAMSSAVLFFILNMLGLGLGPYVVGHISDFLIASPDVAGAVLRSVGMAQAAADYTEADSLRMGMIAAVILTYPLCILWHLGAQRLPPHPAAAAAAGEALTEGDPPR